MKLQEADFGLSELFFSKTDFKGIIQSGNDVFVRISEYQRDELYRKPHNIIRHSDMPASVFKLFWSFLKASRPIAAYVKNKSKTGRYYWVFAMVFPMQDGYLSVRLKPTSELFSIVQKLYAEILEKEKQGLPLEQGIELLLQNLKNLGYESYEQFMSEALLRELKSRDLALRDHSDTLNIEDSDKTIQKLLEVSDGCTKAARSAFHCIGQLNETIQNLLDTTRSILNVCHHVKLVTTNLTITSSKLGDPGKPLSVVSTNLEKLCRDIFQNSTNFEEVFTAFQKSAASMYFAVGTSRFQIEMMNHLILESLASETAKESLSANCTLLKILIAENFVSAEQASLKLIAQNQDLLQSLGMLSKVIAGMDVICVVGKIEMARIQELSASLESLLQDIEKLNLNFKNSLKMMDSECKAGLDNTGSLRRLLEKISSGLIQIEQLVT